MSTQINTAYVQMFKNNFELLSQQLESRLVRAVTEDSINAEFAYYDQLGAVEAVQRTTRHADTPFTEIPHARRRVSADDWELSEIIDKQDTDRMLSDPQSQYVRSFAAAINRRKDRTIMQAFFANALTGKTGGDSVAFPGGQAINVDYVEAGSTTNSSLTVGKLRRARELLMDAEVGEGELYIAVTQREITALLRDPTVTSAEFTQLRALESGEVNRYMGFEFIRLPAARFDLDGSSHRRIPVWHKSGLWFAPLNQMEVNAAVDPTKGFNTRIYARQSFGATRLEEVKVVEIKCSTSVF